MALHQSVTPNSSIELTRMPTHLELFSKALLPVRKNLNAVINAIKEQQESIPKLSMHLNNIKPELKKIKRYAKVCNFKLEEQAVPLTYPHVLAFNLHLKLMTHKSFPLPVLGLVHIRNTITAHRKILMSESLNLHAFIGESRVTHKGIEFDIHSQVCINSEMVWESITTNLYITKKSAKQTPQYNKQLEAQFQLQYHQLWSLPENLGRRYALASGDANPIHLHSLSAKALGFKNAIAHGMWLKAHTIASLSSIANYQSALTITVHFKQPTPLNSEVIMNYQEKATSVSVNKTNTNQNSSNQNNEINFNIRSLDGHKLHMVGHITYPNIRSN